MGKSYYKPGTQISIIGRGLKKRDKIRAESTKLIDGIPEKIYLEMWDVIDSGIKQRKSSGAILSNVKKFLKNNKIDFDADLPEQLRDRINLHISFEINEGEIKIILNHDDLDTEILYFLSLGYTDERIIESISKIPNLEKSSDELQKAVNDMRDVLKELREKLDECAKNSNREENIYTCNPRLIRGFIKDVLSTNSHLRERLYRPRCIITYMTEAEKIEEKNNNRKPKTEFRKIASITPDVITILDNYIKLVRKNEKNKENRCDNFRHSMGTKSDNTDSQGKPPEIKPNGNLRRYLDFVE